MTPLLQWTAFLLRYVFWVTMLPSVRLMPKPETLEFGCIESLGLEFRVYTQLMVAASFAKPPFLPETGLSVGLFPFCGLFGSFSSYPLPKGEPVF